MPICWRVSCAISAMVEVLLVHGSCFGAWAWEAVIPALAQQGHRARAIDLPGRGGAQTTLKAQAAAIVAALTAPTVLVGHSAGGFAISAAAETAPDLVLGLIFVAAYVPKPGLSLADMRRAGPSQPLRGSFRLTPDRRAYSFDPDRCAELFFHDCPNAQAATARMCLEPVAPQETPLSVLRPLPRAAVICTEDRAIPPDYQTAMAEGLPHLRLASGHAPFLSMPANLAAKLHQLFNTLPFDFRE